MLVSGVMLVVSKYCLKVHLYLVVNRPSYFFDRVVNCGYGGHIVDTLLLLYFAYISVWGIDGLFCQENLPERMLLGL